MLQGAKKRPKDFRASEYTQAQHDERAESAARDLATSRKEAEEAKEQARVAADIEQDLLATPPQAALPPQPAGTFAYDDSEDDDEPRQEPGLEVIETFRWVDGRLVRGNTLPLRLTPVVPEWARNPHRYCYKELGRI